MVSLRRDVKAGNILLDGLGAVKIADFGVSEQLSDAVSKSDTRIGTPLWMVCLSSVAEETNTASHGHAHTRHQKSYWD